VFDGGFSSRANFEEIKRLEVGNVVFSKAQGISVDEMAGDEKTFRALRHFRAGVSAHVGLQRCAHAELQHRPCTQSCSIDGRSKRDVIDRWDPGTEGGDDGAAVVVEGGAQREGSSNEPSRLSKGRWFIWGPEVIKRGVFRDQGDEHRA
jgi:hypothetical protein